MSKFSVRSRAGNEDARRFLSAESNEATTTSKRIGTLQRIRYVWWFLLDSDGIMANDNKKLIELKAERL